MSRVFNVQVDEFGIGFPPKLLGVKKGETEYSLNLLPLGGFVRIKGENGEDENDPKSFAHKSILCRFLILISGIGVNFLVGFIILSILFYTGMPFAGDSQEINKLISNGAIIKKQEIVIAAVAPNSPAVSSGLAAKDKIIGFGLANSMTADIYGLDDFQKFVNEHKGKEIILKVETPNNEIKTINVVPRSNPPANEGPLGIAFDSNLFYSYPLGKNFIAAIKLIWESTVLMFKSLGSAFTSIFTQSKAQVAGPIGIAVLTKNISQRGAPFILAFMASLSINLAFMNLLPIPGLDGGKILFLIIEKIKGAPVNKKIESYATAVGLFFLLFIIIVVSIKDITNFL